MKREKRCLGQITSGGSLQVVLYESARRVFHEDTDIGISKTHGTRVCVPCVFIIATYLYRYKLFQSVEYSDGAIDRIKCLLHCLEVGIEDTCQTPVEVC